MTLNRTFYWSVCRGTFSLDRVAIRYVGIYYKDSMKEIHCFIKHLAKHYERTYLPTSHTIFKSNFNE